MLDIFRNPMRTMIVASVISAVMVQVTVIAQGEPNFSGTWVLAEAMNSGATRSTAASDKAVPTTLNTVSGAAFNCGRECTITHKGQTLTVDNAKLASYTGGDEARRTPSVTLHLDGRDATVVDSFNPRLEIRVTAKWQDGKVRIDSRRDPTAKTQFLSLDGSQLVVVSVRYLNGEARGEVTFKYSRRK